MNTLQKIAVLRDMGFVADGTYQESTYFRRDEDGLVARVFDGGAVHMIARVEVGEDVDEVEFRLRATSNERRVRMYVERLIIESESLRESLSPVRARSERERRAA